MAKFTPGQVVSEVSGKLAGVVFSRSRNKAVIRVKKRGKVKAPIRKTISQGYIHSLAKQWRELTQSQRDLWRNFARINPKSDRFGNKHIRNGMQMFVYTNSFYRLINQSVTVTPPLMQVSPRWNTFSATITGSSFTLQFNPSPISSVWRMLVYCTAPVSAGVSSPRPSQYKFVRALNAGTAQNVNIRSDYDAVFGSNSGKQGMRIFIRAMLIRSTGSLVTRPMRTNRIIA